LKLRYTLANAELQFKIECKETSKTLTWTEQGGRTLNCGREFSVDHSNLVLKHNFSGRYFIHRLWWLNL